MSNFNMDNWTKLGEAIHRDRQAIGLPLVLLAKRLNVRMENLKALEKGRINWAVMEDFSKVRLSIIDSSLNWPDGTTRSIITATEKEKPATFSRASYSQRDWQRLGAAVCRDRIHLRMTRNVLAEAVRSTGKSVLRLEEGRVYGDPATAPAGDYNSEKYWFKRLPFVEMALEWPEGAATAILSDPARTSPPTS